MAPIVLAFYFGLACTTAPTPTGQPFPNDYVWPADCLDLACPNVTADMNDYKAPGKGLKTEDLLTLGYESQWHKAQCTGRG